MFKNRVIKTKLNYEKTNKDTDKLVINVSISSNTNVDEETLKRLETDLKNLNVEGYKNLTQNE